MHGQIGHYHHSGKSDIKSTIAIFGPASENSNFQCIALTLPQLLTQQEPPWTLTLSMMMTPDCPFYASHGSSDGEELLCPDRNDSGEPPVEINLQDSLVTDDKEG